jgi:putative ABC transport system permease protein
MFRTAIKGLIAHKLRLVATVVAITLGVAFTAGTLVLTDTIGKTFDDLFGDVYQGTDAVVRGEAVFEGPAGTIGAQRARLDESVLAAVQDVPEVAEVDGGVVGYARLIGKDGLALGNPAMGAPTLGFKWTDSQRLNPFTLVEGSPPATDDEVVIDARSAEKGVLKVGDTTTVLVQGPPRTVRISGIAKFGAADSPGGATVVLFPPTVAQAVLAEPGKYDDISIVAKTGVTQDQVVRSIVRVLPDGAEAITGAAITEESQSETRDTFAFFRTFMLVFAVVGLLVGGFMIFNTFSITVAQRTRENGLLRALGATRRQILSAVLLEALVVGVVASVLGLVAGVAVAMGLKALLDGLGFDIPATGVVLQPRTAIVAIVVGVGVTLIAALSPARKAAKIPPIAAMQEGVAGSVGYGSKQRVIVGSALLVLGVGSLLAGLFASIANPFAVVGFGVLLVFFGVAVLGRTVSLPLSRVIGAPLPRVRGITGELARENAMRNPKRTAASASALMIGVGLVGFITIFVASARASLDDSVDRTFTGDVAVESGGGFMGGVDPSLAEQLNALPEVEAATGLRQNMASVDGSVEFVSGVDPATAFDVFDIKPIAGSTADLGANAIAVHSDVATDRGLQVGDSLPVTFKDTGTQQLRVALVYGESQTLGSYLLGTPAYDANFTTHLDRQVFVKRAAGVSEAAALAAVKETAKAYPGVSVYDRAEFKAAQAQWLNQLLALVYALLGLAIIIALLGIANTLALSIFERVREIGVLRAVGMTRSQLRSTIRWESVIIALQGTLLGLVVGVFFGWALVTALSDQGITVFAVPYASLLAIVVLAALAGMAAAIGPSRWAAKFDVLRAVVSE